MENKNQPINPIEGSHQGIHPKQIIGLTKREYFAGLAMQGLMSNSKVIVNDIENIKQCVLIADELLKKLSDGK